MKNCAVPKRWNIKSMWESSPRSSTQNLEVYNTSSDSLLAFFIIHTFLPFFKNGIWKDNGELYSSENQKHYVQCENRFLAQSSKNPLQLHVCPANQKYEFLIYHIPAFSSLSKWHALWDMIENWNIRNGGCYLLTFGACGAAPFKTREYRQPQRWWLWSRCFEISTSTTNDGFGQFLKAATGPANVCFILHLL
jgi:hypothetical protein